MRLRKDERGNLIFDLRAREILGDLRDYEIARRLNTDASTLSLLRRGRRSPNVAFICDSLTTLARANEIVAPFHDLFEVVPLQVATEAEAA